MSIKDLIWVNTYQNIRAKQDIETENAKRESEAKYLELFYLAIADIRTILGDADYFTRIAALKGSGIRRIEPLSSESLPSVAAERKRQLEERCADMTPEEKELYIFNHGGRIRR